MSNYVVDNEYYQWLLRRIDYLEGDGYDDALEVMFSTPFEWDIPNDDNRAEDGIQLRYIFMDEEGWGTMPLDGKECTFFEMLVALAERIENDVMWDGESDRTDEWFWLMIRNLGIKPWDLSGYTYGIIENFMHHKENVMLFPCDKKLRKSEIWFQAQSFLMKNYEF